MGEPLSYNTALEWARKLDSGKFASDFSCVKCGYNLNGLHTRAASCPECGESVPKSVVRHTYGHWLDLIGPVLFIAGWLLPLVVLIGIMVLSLTLSTEMIAVVWGVVAGLVVVMESWPWKDNGEYLSRRRPFALMFIGLGLFVVFELACLLPDSLLDVYGLTKVHRLAVCGAVLFFYMSLRVFYMAWLLAEFDCYSRKTRWLLVAFAGPWMLVPALYPIQATSAYAVISAIGLIWASAWCMMFLRILIVVSLVRRTGHHLSQATPPLVLHDADIAYSESYWLYRDVRKFSTGARFAGEYDGLSDKALFSSFMPE